MALTPMIEPGGTRRTCRDGSRLIEDDRLSPVITVAFPNRNHRSQVVGDYERRE